MKIRITGAYKSLKDFESCDMGNFCVLTGKNGAGKTQLINLLSQQANFPTHTVEIFPNINKNKIRTIVLSKHNAVPVKNEEYNKRIAQIKGQYSQSNISLPLAKLLIEKGIVNDEITTESLTAVFQGEEEILDNLLTKITGRPFRLHGIANNPGFFLNAAQTIRSQQRFFITYNNICKYYGIELEKIEDHHFQNYPYAESLMEPGGFFDSQIEYIFFNYAKRRWQNSYDNFIKINEAVKNNSVPDHEFLLLNPAPWAFLNELLFANGLNYSFPEIRFTSVYGPQDVQIHLLKNNTKERIELHDLSSGEKVIIDLIIKLFTASYFDNTLELPELLALDEPDAYLHPEMTNLLIKVLYETFVLKYKVKVILTTHSPSTVALVPDDCIYEIRNSPSCSIQNITKDNALKILTGNIPTLSIDYKNHRQIFVESPRDVYYYQTIFSKLRQEKAPDFNLYFISNSLGTGNCTQVMEIIEQLRNAGMKTCLGLVDWDLENSSITEILVHGENKRYSLENYLLDPIYLAVLFLQKGAYNIKTELSFGNVYNEYSLEKETEARLQEISDWIIKKIYERFRDLEKSNFERTEVEYYNHAKIRIPMWYAKTQGHELEDKLSVCFEPISNLKRNNTLHKTMTEIVGKCFPLIPNDTVKVLRQIQVNAFH